MQPEPQWEVPVIESYNSRYHKEERSKAIIRPFYIRDPSEPERLFIELLESSKLVKWWFKNGENEVKYFALLYRDNGIEKSFYVDFITGLKMVILDYLIQKGNSERLKQKLSVKQYSKEQNKKGKRLWGGIVDNM